jgi:hypothetical protein
MVLCHRRTSLGTSGCDLIRFDRLAPDAESRSSTDLVVPHGFEHFG